MCRKVESIYFHAIISSLLAVFYQVRTWFVYTTNIILLVSISRGPSGKPFNFTFDQRSQFDVIDELGRFMSNICKVVPDGVVCFFPSYTYCDVVLRRWQATKKFDKIQKAKRIFHEPSDQPGLENILDKYTQEIKKVCGLSMLMLVTKYFRGVVVYYAV